MKLARCEHCGAPLDVTGNAPRVQCAFCGAVNERPHAADVRAAVREVVREDANRNGIPDILEGNHPPTPSAAPNRSWSRAGVFAFVVLVIALPFASTFALLHFVRPAPRPQRAVAPAPTPPQPTKSSPAIGASASASMPVAASPPLKTARSAAPVASAAPVSNEAWGQRKLLARMARFRFCMAQELFHNPSAPRAYTVTATVGEDGLPINSLTSFAPAPSSGFRRCATNVVAYAFETAPPERRRFTFSLSLSFADVKPATKLAHGYGWD